MTNLEKIQSLDLEQMTKLLVRLDAYFVPRKWHCDSVYCIECKENYSCFREWLEKEAKE